VLRAILSAGAAPAAHGCSAPRNTPDATALSSRMKVQCRKLVRLTLLLARLHIV